MSKIKNFLFQDYLIPKVVAIIGIFGLIGYGKGDKQTQDASITQTTKTHPKNKNLETWVETFKDSSFCLDCKNYTWKEHAFYDIDNNGKNDGILIKFNKNNKERDSPWTGAVGYFEFDKEGGGKINPNAKIVYPFKEWDSEKCGKGLKDTNGNGILNKTMNFKETNEFSKKIHYKTNKDGKNA
jgi:hypothetical protein